MENCEIRSIRSSNNKDVTIEVPPSKSYMNRALFCAALAEGTSVLHNPSYSDDSKYFIHALHAFGIRTEHQKNALLVYGTGEKLQIPNKEIFVGNAGTTLRFLTTFAALAKGETVLSGDVQMQQRPIQDLLDALHSAGIHSESANGFPPVKIYGGKFLGGELKMNATISSQFLSSILLCAPYSQNGVTVKIEGSISSRPYVDMTIDVMKKFGVSVELADEHTFKISSQKKYTRREYTIENDASSASYFFAAAAITKSEVTVKNLSAHSLQGDIAFLDVLEQMGCRVNKKRNEVSVTGKKLNGITVDMNAMLDAVPTLAVVALFADGVTTITNVSQLKFKESDRMTAIATELKKVGAEVEVYDDSLVIIPQKYSSATIETYNDHRIAMSFAVAGLCIEGIGIKNPSCVSKSFPGFWDEFSKLESTK